ncbi:unnamed protein product, partial [Adineta ricciae]
PSIVLQIIDTSGDELDEVSIAQQPVPLANIRNAIQTSHIGCILYIVIGLILGGVLLILIKVTLVASSIMVIPTQCSTYTTITDSTRRVSSTSCCQNDYNYESGWYRFTGEGGTQLVTTPLHQNNICSSSYPGWWNGTLPVEVGSSNLFGFSLNPTNMVQLKILLWITMLISYWSLSNAIVFADFRRQALDEHNALRRLHCTGAMVLNSSLNSRAQNYANYLARNKLFQHSGAPRLGENLWSSWSPVPLILVNGSAPTVSWYSEIKSYKYRSPGFSSATGHFTQVIWKSSTQLGIGVVFANNNTDVYVVANYYPPGNILGSFPANVLRLCFGLTKPVQRTTTLRTKKNNSDYKTGSLSFNG